MKNSKLSIFILVLITGLTFSSCNKSKDPTPADNLIGTWTTGTSTVTVMVGTISLTQYAIDVLHLTTSEAQLYATVLTELIKQGFTGTIQIKSDNTYTSNIGGEADSGTWILSADSKKLTIDSSTDVPMIFDIVELTAKNLKIKMEQTESEDLNEDDIPESINIKAEINFTK
jgi:hypothetical protein